MADQIAGAMTQPLALMDTLRQMQGDVLDAWGFGPRECRHRMVASERLWRLRAYGGDRIAPALLIVAAPIKKPYVWDLAPSASVVRQCLAHGLQVFLLEWLGAKPGQGETGLGHYAHRFIAAAVAAIREETNGAVPFLMGHSLGGTFAAIFGAVEPRSVRGIVLLGTPLCFSPSSSRFRDAIVVLTPSSLRGTGVVPGSLLSALSALASPETFVWSRLVDAGFSSLDLRASTLHARIERWVLDETPLPRKLVQEVLQWLYRENRFFEGNLRIGNKVVGPASLRIPMLAAVNTADDLAPPAAVRPFVEAVPGDDVRVVEYPGESGVGLQHLALLVGHQAHVRVWPEIISWLHAR